MITDITFYHLQYKTEGSDWRWVKLSDDFIISDGPLQYPFRGFKHRSDAEDLISMLKRSNLEHKEYRVVRVNGYSQVEEIEDVLLPRREVQVLRPVEA